VTTNPKETPVTAPTTTASTNPKETTVTSTENSPQIAEPAPGTGPGPEGTETAPEAGEGTSKDANEAKTYRLRLRDAEAERDKLAATVAAFQRRDIEALAASGDGKKLGAGSDLWVAGIELKDLLAEDGTVDAAKVSAAVEQVLTDHPNWGPRPPRVGVPRDMGQGQRGGTVGGVRSMQQILRDA
jgi:hypothetical protein